MAPTAIVTGASRGIGRSTALELARQGHDLVLVARERDSLEIVAEEVRRLNRGAIALTADVRDPESVKNFIKEATNWGDVAVLVNNAGIYSSGPVEDFTLSDWHQVLDTNLWGYIHTIEAILPHFLARGEGKIANLCSIAGTVAFPYHVPYSTSKFAIAGLSKSLHAELAPKNIHVCAIYPSLVKTEFLDRAVLQGKSESERRDRYEQIEQVLEYPVIDNPDKVASAVWKALHQRRQEIYVGTAGFNAFIDRFLPGSLQWGIRRVFQRPS